MPGDPQGAGTCQAVQEKLIALGSEPAGMTPAEFDKFFQAQIKLNGDAGEGCGDQAEPVARLFDLLLVSMTRASTHP